MSFKRMVFEFRDAKTKEIDAYVVYEDEIDFVKQRRKVRVPFKHLAPSDLYEAGLGYEAISKALEEIQAYVEKQTGKRYGSEDIHKRLETEEDDLIKFFSGSQS